MIKRRKKDFFADAANEQYINRKSVDLMKRFMTRFGDVKPRKYTGNSVAHQKAIKQAIIRARELGLLPYLR